MVYPHSSSVSYWYSSTPGYCGFENDTCRPKDPSSPKKSNPISHPRHCLHFSATRTLHSWQVLENSGYCTTLKDTVATACNGYLNAGTSQEYNRTTLSTHEVRHSSPTRIAPIMNSNPPILNLYAASINSFNSDFAGIVTTEITSSGCIVNSG